MRDHASLHRLAEMGIDVYLPRNALRRGAVTARVGEGAAEPATSVAMSKHAVLFADDAAPAARALSTDIVRSLKFARIACVAADGEVEAALAEAAAVILFGEAQARRAGALLPAPRQRDIAWVVTGEAASLRGNPHARRALWSELKRIVRELAQPPDPARG